MRRKTAGLLTKYLDKLPFISTKEISTMSFSGEFAKLLPGQLAAGRRGENGVSYLDDFENARTPYTLGGLKPRSGLAPGVRPRCPLRGNNTGLAAAYNRAKLAWYTVDQTYYTNGQSKPDNIGAADLKNHYIRGIKRNEVFPNRDLGATGNGFEYTFDLAYFPDERGPVQLHPQLRPAAGPPSLPTLRPRPTRPGRQPLPRDITFDTDFDNSNIEYLEFWLMDPFLPGDNGKMIDNDGHNQNNEHRRRPVHEPGQR